jgi:hypothetical protein
MTPILMGIPQGSYETFFGELDICFDREERLRGHGIEIYFPVAADAAADSVYDVIKGALPHKAISVPISAEEQHLAGHMMSWPRDALLVSGGYAYIQPTAMSISAALVGALAPSAKRVCSSYAEGGLHIDVDNYVVGTGNDVEAWKRIPGLEHKKMIRMPLPWYDGPKKLGQRLRDGGHIDTQLNMASSTAGRLLCVTQCYQKAYPAEVRALIDELGVAAMHIVSNRKELGYCPVNFTQLPDGRILIPEYAYSTIDFLSRYMDDADIIPVETFPNEVYVGGGLRCLTNVLPQTAAEMQRAS